MENGKVGTGGRGRVSVVVVMTGGSLSERIGVKAGRSPVGLETAAPGYAAGSCSSGDGTRASRAGWCW